MLSLLRSAVGLVRAHADLYERSRARAWEQASALAAGHGRRFRLVEVPSAGHCLYSSLQASLHGTWHAQGDVELRRAVNLHGRGMNPNIWIEEVRCGPQYAMHIGRHTPHSTCILHRSVWVNTLMLGADEHDSGRIGGGYHT